MFFLSCARQSRPQTEVGGIHARMYEGIYRLFGCEGIIDKKWHENNTGVNYP
ncbi:MAG TPA: hypothetical protein VJJ51_12590 [Candidatus Methanoperedens sp.]|nr:hypothetical protein [Candidatus Methanoperedens sp.]